MVNFKPQVIGEHMFSASVTLGMFSLISYSHYSDQCVPTELFAQSQTDPKRNVCTNKPSLANRMQIASTLVISLHEIAIDLFNGTR